MKAPEYVPDLILGIEEPELYQHPNRQRHLSRILWDLSQGNIPGVAKRTQVIYCTHSPLFIDLTRFNCLRRFSKISNSEDGNKPLVSRCSCNSLSNVAQVLQQAHEEQPVKPFTPESLQARLSTLMTPWTNEGFFGDAVVLVEGEDDRCAILGAAMNRGIDLESKGIAVIPTSGKQNIDRLYLIFKGFEIPVYAIFDADVRDMKNESQNRKSNRLLQRLLKSKEIKDFPETQVSENFAVFQDKLETELRSAIGDEIYTKTFLKFANDYGYTEVAACQKSPTFVKVLLAEADTQKKSFKILDDIINKINTLLDFRRSNLSIARQ